MECKIEKFRKYKLNVDKLIAKELKTKKLNGKRNLVLSRMFLPLSSTAPLKKNKGLINNKINI